LNDQVLASVPHFLVTIKDDIAGSIIRAGGELPERTRIEDIVVKAIHIVTVGIRKTGSQAVANLATPLILQVWRTDRWHPLTRVSIGLLYNLNVPADIGMSCIVVLAIGSHSDPKLRPFVQARLMALIAETVGLFQIDQKIFKELMNQAHTYETPPTQFPGTASERRVAEAELAVKGSKVMKTKTLRKIILKGHPL
jgi:hypothetical protein